MPKTTQELYEELLAKGDAAQQQANDLLAQYDARGPFSYNAATDPLFQSVKDQYVHQGQRAMQDTMGQAAGLTGGYGSSYAQNVGQQAYDEYLQRLNDIVPDLYAQERSAYAQEGEDLYNQMAAARGFASDAYNQWADEYNRQHTREREELEDYWRTVQWNKGLEDEQKAEDKEKEQKAQEEKDRAWDDILTILKMGGMPTDEMIAASGKDKETIQSIYDGYQRTQNDEKAADAYSKVLDMISRGMTPSDELIAQAGLTAKDVADMQANLNKTDPADVWNNAKNKFNFYVSMGVMPPDDVLNALGVTRADAQRLINEALAGNFSGGSGSSGGGGGSGSGHGGSSSYDYDYDETEPIATNPSNPFTDPSSDVPSTDQWRAESDNGALSQDVLSYGYKGPGVLSTYGQNVMNEWLSNNYGMSFTYYLTMKYKDVPSLVADTDIPILRGKG